MKAFCVCIFFFSACAPAFAWQEVTSTVPSPPGSPNADKRITLNIVVNDKSGKPVTGLQQQDFTILDNKQPQKITSFESIGQAKHPENNSEIVLVIDAVNTPFSRVGYEREQVKKFLRQDAGKLAWPLSIDFFTDAGLKIQNQASRDGNALVAFLDQNQTGLRTINRSQGFYGAADRSQLSLRSLAELAAFEEKRPGRKFVIWISPGWPLLTGPNVQLSNKDQQNIFDTIVATSTELRHANVTLYSVDPLGTSDSGVFRTFYYEQFLKGVTSPKQVQIGNLALQVIADQSGGRVLNSNNDVAGEIERCIRDADTYYVLSFDRSSGEGPNEYHAIDVKLSQPGLKAQTRYGYYAQPTGR